MSFNGLAIRETINVAGSLSDSVSGTSQTVQYGAGSLPSLTTIWEYGTGANASAPAVINADCWYLPDPETISATSYWNVTLYNSVDDAEGNVLDFAHINRIDLIVNNPTGSNPVNIGPQNQTHAWGGAANTPWPGGTGATVYDQTFWHYRNTHPFTGFAVDHTTPADVLPIYNPESSSVTVTLWLIGQE